MAITKLIETLKSENEDFEFYPTEKNMIEAICDHYKNLKGYVDCFKSVLDIGCGTCNFKKYSKFDIKKYNKL